MIRESLVFRAKSECESPSFVERLNHHLRKKPPLPLDKAQKPMRNGKLYAHSFVARQSMWLDGLWVSSGLERHDFDHCWFLRGSPRL